MVTEQQCCQCKQVKSADEFGKDKRVSSGLKSRCRDCQREYDSQYYKQNRAKEQERNHRYHQEHKEEIRERHRDYREADPEKYIELNREWFRIHRVERAIYMRCKRREKPEYHRDINRRSYRRNIDTRRKASRRYYRRNRDGVRQAATRYRQENPDKVRHWNRNRRVRLAGVEGTFTKGQWQKLCSFFQGHCPRCGRKVKRFSLDHIIPLSWPETNNWITNIQPLCRSCNSVKHDSYAVDYRPREVREWAIKERGVR